MADAVGRPSVQRLPIGKRAKPTTTTVNSAIGQISGAISLQPLPLSSMPRTIRIAWVVGNMLPSHCAQTGMPRNGNMKPESMKDGIRVNWASWTACIWLAAMVEKVTPSARLLGDEEAERAEQQRQRAADRQAEEQRRRDQDQRDLDIADEHVGHDLGDHHLDRPDRHRQQVLHRAALALAVIASVVTNSVENSQHDADQAGHDVEHGELLGIVAGVHDELERRRLRLRSGGSAAGRG